MTATFGLPHIPLRKRLLPGEKVAFDAQVAEVYRTNPQATIRALMNATGRSYGYVHRVITQAPDVTPRRRGGAHHRLGRRRKQHA